MKPVEIFQLLQEGSPNSLGRVLEVVTMIENQELTLFDVYSLYLHEDSIVSMRVSNIIKRLWRIDQSYVVPLIDSFIKDAKILVNPTFRWTIAQIVDELYDVLSMTQIEALSFIVFENLSLNKDWILLTQSLKACLKLMKKSNVAPPYEVIQRLVMDPRNAVANQAKKVMNLYEA